MGVSSACREPCRRQFMTHLGGAVTVSDTVGPALVVEPVLLEATPLASTPTSGKVWVVAGAIPSGGRVVGVVLPHAGSKSTEPLRINRARSPQALLAFLPLRAAPRLTTASRAWGLDRKSTRLN